VDFAVLEDDACCGYPMYDIGQMGVMRENGLRTAEIISQYRPSVILTTCAGCYRALKVVYPESLGIELDGQVLHSHDFFPSRLKNRLQTIARKVAFHDPCVTGRHMGIYDEPRALIESIPGVELVEMYSTREHGLCCGAGGGVLNAFDDVAAEVAIERLNQAAGAGAVQVLSSCPTCVLNLKRSVSKAGLEVQATDLVELLNEAVQID
jgi:heterodisulfide reductase subunit D